MVNKILKASASKKHYAVLGLRNWELSVGPLKCWKLQLGKKPYTIRRLTTKQIKSKYRTLARLVHPDKNKDGRAEEAFTALEKSAAVLTNEEERREYDRIERKRARQKREEKMRLVSNVVHLIQTNVLLVIRLAKKIMGPFATPILLLGSLMI